MNRTIQLLRLATVVMSAAMIAWRLKQTIDESKGQRPEREAGWARR